MMQFSHLLHMGRVVILLINEVDELLFFYFYREVSIYFLCHKTSLCP